MSSKAKNYQMDRRKIRHMEKQSVKNGSEVTQSKMMGGLARREYGGIAVDTDGFPNNNQEEND